MSEFENMCTLIREQTFRRKTAEHSWEEGVAQHSLEGLFEDLDEFLEKQSDVFRKFIMLLQKQFAGKGIHKLPENCYITGLPTDTVLIGTDFASHFYFNALAIHHSIIPEIFESAESYFGSLDGLVLRVVSDKQDNLATEEIVPQPMGATQTAQEKVVAVVTSLNGKKRADLKTNNKLLFCSYNPKLRVVVSGVVAQTELEMTMDVSEFYKYLQVWLDKYSVFIRVEIGRCR